MEIFGLDIMKILKVKILEIYLSLTEIYEKNQNNMHYRHWIFGL